MKKWLLAFGVILALAGVIWIHHDLHRPYRAYSGSLILVIEPGTRAPKVAAVLVERGVLARRAPFLARYALGRRRRRYLKAGEYLFDRPLAPEDVYQKLVLGDVYLHPVVIPEGSDRFEMARILREQLGLDANAFLRVTEQTSMIRDLDPRAPTLEGYLYPDTYRFARDVTPSTVVETMLARFRRVFGSKFNADLLQSNASLHDVITLASLAEKETPDPSERPLIAGVFEKRLEKGWPLACDPTVIYAARLDRRRIGGPSEPIKASDLKFDSPFNTYLKAGLPPGPIASPGEISIRAALHPATGDSLYFVSNNHGGHLFARTLAEHQRNVARYRSEVAELRRAGQVGQAGQERSDPAEQHAPKKSRGRNRATQNLAKSAGQQK